MSKLDDAIAAVMAASQKSGCWAYQLEGEAAEFVDRLQAEEQKGNKVSRVMTRKILKDAFDIQTSEKAIRNHLAGLCSCES